MSDEYVSELMVSIAQLEERAEKAEAMAEKLAEALREAKGNLQWSTGAWGLTDEKHLRPARQTLGRYLAEIDVALAEYDRIKEWG